MPESPVEPPPPLVAAPAPSTSSAPAADSAYKKAVAEQIARASKNTFDAPLPPMLKSVVVLNVTIGRDGGVEHVSVRRSNGFLALEQRAMDSVRQAAPFAPPGRRVSFLETFLFRDDGRFRIRTLEPAG